MFQINDTVFNQIEIANWEFNPHSTGLNLQHNFNSQRIHVWQARVMDVDKWIILDALRGQFVNLHTTNHEDRNSATLRIYPRARLIKLTGNHTALHMADVEIEFRVL